MISRIAHQGLERTQAERLVDDLVDQPLALVQVEQVGALAAEVLGRAPHLHPQLLLVHRADGAEVHAADQLLVQVLLVVQEPLLGRHQRAIGRTRWRLHSTHRWSDPLRKSVVRRTGAGTELAGLWCSQGTSLTWHAKACPAVTGRRGSLSLHPGGLALSQRERGEPHSWGRAGGRVRVHLVRASQHKTRPQVRISHVSHSRWRPVS